MIQNFNKIFLVFWHVSRASEHNLGLGLETSIIRLFYLWSSVFAELNSIVTNQCLCTDSNFIVQL